MVRGKCTYYSPVVGIAQRNKGRSIPEDHFRHPVSRRRKVCRAVPRASSEASRRFSVPTPENSSFHPSSLQVSFLSIIIAESRIPVHIHRVRHRHATEPAYVSPLPGQCPSSIRRLSSWLLAPRSGLASAPPASPPGSFCNWSSVLIVALAPQRTARHGIAERLLGVREIGCPSSHPSLRPLSQPVNLKVIGLQSAHQRLVRGNQRYRRFLCKSDVGCVVGRDLVLQG